MLLVAKRKNTHYEPKKCHKLRSVPTPHFNQPWLRVFLVFPNRISKFSNSISSISNYFQTGWLSYATPTAPPYPPNRSDNYFQKLVDVHSAYPPLYGKITPFLGNISDIVIFSDFADTSQSLDCRLRYVLPPGGRFSSQFHLFLGWIFVSNIWFVKRIDFTWLFFYWQESLGEPALI